MKTIFIFLALLAAASASGLANSGRNCWWRCGRQQGPCDWCGTGVCCRSGWWDTRNGCDGVIGGHRKHACVEASEGPGNDPDVEEGLLNAGRNCWRACGRQQGPCAWCGTGVCCRSGWWDTSNGCDGIIGHHRRHACVLPAPTEAVPTTVAPTTEAPVWETTEAAAPTTEAPVWETTEAAAPTTEAPVVETTESDSSSGGLTCQSDSACLTEAEMPGWESLFADQPNAPCLTLSGRDGKWCFTSTTGSIKQCSCWDDSVEYDNEWCNTGKFGADHTMCIYEAGAQAACGVVSVSGITDQAMKDAIVSKHNDLRSKVANGLEVLGVDGTQPKAANMRELVWNDELAEVAQRWVDQCAGAHDSNRRTETFSSVGQNWAAMYGGNHDDSNAKATQMVENWYSEVKDITLKAVNSYSSDLAVTGSTGVIGHYTQVVWAETAEVGCGYMTSSNDDYGLESVLVCNYGPAGNWLGAPVYEQGDPGSNCPADTSKTADGLCA